MSDDDLELQAADFVLGVMDAEQRSAFERRLASDPSLREQVAMWEARLGADLSEEVPVPTRIKRNLDAAIDASELPGTHTVRSGEGDWEIVAPGAARKSLHRDTEQGFETYLLRLSPGAELPGHGHSTSEECFVITGELIIGGVRFTEGDYHLAPAGVTHPDARSDLGGLVFVRAPLDEDLQRTGAGS